MRGVSDFLAARARTARILPAVIAWALCLPSLYAGEAMTPQAAPPLHELRKPVEPVQQKPEDAPVLPAPVRPDRRIADPAILCPTDAVWYLAVPDSARLVQDWGASPIGSLMRESAMERTFRNNRFGLQYLFSDLPTSIVSRERVSIISSLLELSRVLAGMSEKMAVACYLDRDAGFRFLFLFDVGLNREPAFNKIAEWETAFFLSNPGADATRGDHSGNYLDVWRIGKRGGTGANMSAAAGFAENMAIVSNDAALAAASLELLKGGASLAESSWGKRLAATIPTTTSVDAVAFLRMDALLAGLDQTPIARDLITVWTDYLGNGGDRGEAIYYGLQFTGEGARETFLLPTAARTEAASLIEVLSRRLKPAEQWRAPQVMPYLPNPVFYLGAKLEGRELGALLRQENRLFGGPGNAAAFIVPPEVRRLFGDDMGKLLSGELGLAFFPADEGRPQWLMALPCSADPSAILPKTRTMTEKNGSTIHSPDADWRRTPGWSIVSPAIARRAGGYFLLLASDGNLLEATLDQLVSGSSFQSNRDFARSMDRMESNQGLFFYINAPEILVREYPQLSPLMRSLYPRSSGLNSRPSLALLRRYTQGFLGAVAPAGDPEFTRVTMQAPIPALGTLAASVMLQFPRELRADGREGMLRSQENLKNLWLGLQLYSNRFGHFPDTLEDMIPDMRGGMTDEEIRGLFTAPAALSRLNATDAAQHSYRYLSGATPGDEPDLPVIYEAEPWSEDFSGMYPTLPDRAPSETGIFQPYRQMILLDGTVQVVSEKYFKDKILPRLEDRE